MNIPFFNYPLLYKEHEKDLLSVIKDVSSRLSNIDVENALSLLEKCSKLQMTPLSPMVFCIKTS